MKVNDTARSRNATNAARSTGSRGRPRTLPAPSPPVFGILILIATVLDLSPNSIQTMGHPKRFETHHCGCPFRYHRNKIHSYNPAGGAPPTKESSPGESGSGTPIVPPYPQTKRDPQYITSP